MKKLRTIVVLVLALAICTVLLTGCVRTIQLPTPPQNSDTPKVNVDTAKEDETVEVVDSKDKPGVDDKKTDVSKPEENTGNTGDKPAYIGDDWEVVVKYDADGLVTEVTAYNDDTYQSKSYSGYEGRVHDEVVNELIAAIKNEGYFIDDVDRERNHDTIEISDRYDHDDRFEDKYERYDWD